MPRKDSREPRSVAAYTHPAPAAPGGEQAPDTQPGDYYVSCYDKHAPNLGTYLLLGPFRNDHGKALSYVETARACCCANDGGGKACWMAYGTVRLDSGEARPTLLVLGEHGEVCVRPRAEHKQPQLGDRHGADSH